MGVKAFEDRMPPHPVSLLLSVLVEYVYIYIYTYKFTHSKWRTAFFAKPVVLSYSRFSSIPIATKIVVRLF